jgi:hypothetical protein
MGTDKASPSLPCDLLSEVLARCDHETLVRCAASSRLLCRCMLDDPAILRRRGACNGAAFAPSLLLGAFYNTTSRGAAAGTRFVEAPAPDVVPRGAIRSFVSDYADLLGRFDKPVACRSAGGLVVLLRRDAAELCVCNPMTGQICFLAPSEVHASSAAILIGDDAAWSGSAFQLLAVDMVCDDLGYNIRSQLFSSAGSFPAIMPAGAWGPVRRVLDEDGRCCFSAAQDPPVVINRVAHWLDNWSAAYDCRIFALDVDEGCAGRIEVPWKLRQAARALLLASTPDRRLSILVPEEVVISMFVLSPGDSSPGESMTWERRVVAVREGILAPPRRMHLFSFGERSGTVVIAMACLEGKLLLNLETKEVTHMSPEPEESPFSPCQLYEMDLPSLTAALLKSPSSCASAASSRLSIKLGQVLAIIDTAS